jgi:chemotaxis protein methyltransferase CheR
VSSLPFSADSLLDDPLYPRLIEHLVESTGLAYYADKDHGFARRVGRRLASTGSSDCTSYFDILRDPLRGPAELEELIAEIAIGETYFFRHQEHFDALRDRVLPDLISRNRFTSSLRIWCAGCADGPEPYSLAILIKREMADQLSGWHVSILGTDINRHSLARAREGRFEEWALRGMPAALKHECFSKEGKLWSLKLVYKRGVSFQYHNLVENSFPSLVHNLSAFDLIVCRNLLIYFGPELVHRLILQFHQCLVPGGWLLVGPAEQNTTSFTLFRTSSSGRLPLYQRSGVPAQNPVPETSGPPAPPPHTVFKAAERLESLDTPIDQLDRRSPEADTRSADAMLAKVRSHADRGEWRAAAQCCDDLLARDNLNSLGHFYQGLVLEQMQEPTRAEQSLRRAIYLDRQSALAHYYLGLVLQSRGRAGQASRCFENTLRLLDTTSKTHRFPDADGITAGELGGLAGMHLRILQERICNLPV